MIVALILLCWAQNSSAVLKKGDKFYPFSLKSVDQRTFTVRLEQGKLTLLTESGEAEKKETKKTYPDAILLDFWATWCVPCRAAMPSMQQIHEKYQPRAGQEKGGLNLLGVALDQKGSLVVKPLYQKSKVTYPMLADPTSGGEDNFVRTTRDMAKKYKVQEIPVVYLINSRGDIVHVHVGFKKKEIADLKSMVEKSIMEKKE
jgi:thiol-disulfide isomerase/thioredoxin